MAGSLYTHWNLTERPCLWCRRASKNNLRFMKYYAFFIICIKNIIFIFFLVDVLAKEKQCNYKNYISINWELQLILDLFTCHRLYDIANVWFLPISHLYYIPVINHLCKYSFVCYSLLWFENINLCLRYAEIKS